MSVTQETFVLAELEKRIVLERFPPGRGSGADRSQ